MKNLKPITEQSPFDIPTSRNEGEQMSMDDLKYYKKGYQEGFTDGYKVGYRQAVEQFWNNLLNVHDKMYQEVYKNDTTES